MDKFPGHDLYDIEQKIIDMHAEQQRQTLIMLDIAQLLRQIRLVFQTANSESP